MRWRTRFAPAPTGYLHLGHVVNAVHVWGLARAHGGEVLLRIEDHDGTRCRPAYETALLEDLDWLGFEPDIGSTVSFREDPNGHAQRQSNNSARYEAARAQLSAQGCTYQCLCSRREIAESSARPPGEELHYFGRCRTAGHTLQDTLATRLLIDDGIEQFVDGRLGLQEQQPSRQCGDLLIRDRHGQWTYQFAVVVDDLAHHIDVVIRGEDLLSSTGRQRQLARMLGRSQPIGWWHHALVVHPDGRKLSKANHDTSIRDRRAAGASAASLLGEAAFHAGLISKSQPLSVDDLPALFPTGPSVAQ